MQYSPLPLHILVDGKAEEARNARVVPVRREHDEEAEGGAEKGKRPGNGGS